MCKALLALGALLLCALRPAGGQGNGVSPFAGSRAGSSYSGDISGDRFEEVEGRGLLIRSRPAGARVFVEGVERGLSPLLLDTLASGEYHVRLVKEGYGEREFTVRILAGNRLEISVELQEARGQALILVRREGAPPAYPFTPEIYVDGRLFSGWKPVLGEGALPGTSGYALSLPAGRHMLKIASFGWEEAGGTALIRPGETVSLELKLSPSPFRLFPGPGPGRPRFNPANPGALGYTDYRFGVSAPGRGKFSILDREGRELYAEELPPFRGPSQRLAWNGRDPRKRPLPDGDYTLLIEAAPDFNTAAAPEAPPGIPEEWRIRVPLSIDSSVSHYPLTLSGAVSGLFFTPLPPTLPRGGFQVEGNILFGEFPGAAGGGAFSSLPFEAGFRFAPLEGLEFAAALEAIPALEGAADWGFSLSPKWRFLKTGLFDAAAAAGFSWSGNMDLSPRRGGASIQLPLSWNGLPLFSASLAPGLYWRQWREGSPRILLGAGALYRFAGFSAGISLRQEYRVHKPAAGGEDEGPVVLLWAAELKWQPPRTNMVFTLLGGFRYGGEENAGFGGLGMGAIY
ncbi:MAG: PEGA domain-containing protein [Treponema sp.]|jgi:hypothetical protein|nr:PEGA domain-containing protein [Treponema sp.]